MTAFCFPMLTMQLNRYQTRFSTVLVPVSTTVVAVALASAADPLKPSKTDNSSVDNPEKTEPCSINVLMSKSLLLIVGSKSL